MLNDNSEESSIRSYLDSDDPLCQEAIGQLIAHREEDLHVDYKESFDPGEEKQWHGITTDCMAFANTIGGYIVFGITDGDFSIVGLSETATEALVNTNMIMQKLNRYVSPPFSQIRTKMHNTEEGKTIVVMFIPESKGKTHVFVKDVSYKYPSGETKQIAHAGMIFIRRSATNHVMGPDDLDFILNRRIDYYKDAILDKIAKVVNAPAEHQLLIFDPEAKSPRSNSYFISDSDDAVPVKGMSFTVAPRTDTEELCGWISLSLRDPSFQPTEERLWHMYSVRRELCLTDEQKLHVVRFSFFGEAPIFYWLKSLSAGQIKPLLLRIVKQTSNMRIRTDVLQVGAFLGKKFYVALLKRVGEERAKLRQNLREFPRDAVERYCGTMGALDENLTRTEEKLDFLTSELSERRGGVIEKFRARVLDCRLYARSDKYIGEKDPKREFYN